MSLLIAIDNHKKLNKLSGRIDNFTENYFLTNCETLMQKNPNRTTNLSTLNHVPKTLIYTWLKIVSIITGDVTFHKVLKNASYQYLLNSNFIHSFA